MLQELDDNILLFVNKTGSSPFLDQVLPSITDLHKNMAFAAIAVLLLCFFVYKFRWQGFFFLVTLAAVIGIDDAFCGQLVKPFFSRLRPDRTQLDLVVRAPEYGGFSFPSNHAANMFCMATFLSFYFPRFRFLYFFCAFLIAYSRVYSGVHYPSDVLGGACIGIFFGWVGAFVSQRWIHFRSEKEAHV